MYEIFFDALWKHTHVVSSYFIVFSNFVNFACSTFSFWLLHALYLQPSSRWTHSIPCHLNTQTCFWYTNFYCLFLLFPELQNHNANCLITISTWLSAQASQSSYMKSIINKQAKKILSPNASSILQTSPSQVVAQAKNLCVIRVLFFLHTTSLIILHSENLVNVGFRILTILINFFHCHLRINHYHCSEMTVITFSVFIVSTLAPVQPILYTIFRVISFYSRSCLNSFYGFWPCSE